MSYINVSFFRLIYSLTVSNLNSLATVTWEDFISQIPQFRSFTDKRQLLLIKVIGKSALYYLQWWKLSKFLLHDIRPQTYYHWFKYKHHCYRHQFTDFHDIQCGYHYTEGQSILMLSNCKSSIVHSLDVGTRQVSFNVLPWKLYQLQKLYVPQWIMRGWFGVLARM